MGDPNETLPAETDKEMQYYIKWKNWAHIHNTWESEANLREQKVNGIKKLENYMKRMDEIREWWVFFHRSFYLNIPEFWDGQARANSVDSDQMPHSA